MEKKMLSSKWYATIDNESDKPVVMSKTGYWNDVVAICDSAKTAQHIAFIHNKCLLLAENSRK